MNTTNAPAGAPEPPPLAQLLAQYLQGQTAAHAAGVAVADLSGEVVPFDVAPVQPVDPALAWAEALAAVRQFQPGQAAPAAPPDWPALIAAQEPAAALAFCTGNYPQLIRNLQPLLHAGALADLRPTAARPLGLPALAEWATRQKALPQTFLAVGVLRLARQFDAAAELLQSRRPGLPRRWQAAWANEEAALAWHRGSAEEAAARWQAQAASVPVLFNRGLAALFLDRPAEARPWLSQAVAQLPEDGGWHHLGCLYLALAELRAPAAP
jgi:hypothetical protein